MNDKNNINKLEELFRNRLQNFSTDENDDWNIPGDDVFDNAQAIFNEKEKDDRFIPFFWYFIGLGFLCLIIIAGFIITNSNISQIQNEINHINQQSILSPTSKNDFSKESINIKDSQNNNDQTNQLNEFNHNTNTILNNDEVKANSKQLNNPPQSSSTKIKTNNNASEDNQQRLINESKTQSLKNQISTAKTQSLLFENTTQIKEENQFNSQIITTNNNTPPLNGENQNNELVHELAAQDFIPSLKLDKAIAIPIIQPTLEENILSQNIDEIKTKLKKPSIKRHKYHLALLYAPSLSAVKVKDELTNKTSKGEFTFTNNFDLNLKYDISQYFYLRSGISFNKYRINSNYFVMSYYNNSTEQNINGVYETNILMDIETPLGKATGDVIILHASDTPIPEGDMISSELELSHFFSAIEIPLNLGVQKRINNRFSINAETGISYNKSFNNEMCLDAIMKHDDHVMDQKNPSVVSYDAFKKSFFNYNIELGSSYQLTNSLRWYLGAAYKHTISSVIQKENTKTNIQTINIKTGLTYSF